MKISQEGANKGIRKGLLNLVVGSGARNNGQDVEYLHKLVI